jgi:peptidoglycan/xylan/chitin deacetylase (PgdA/CDA1 family)
VTRAARVLLALFVLGAGLFATYELAEQPQTQVFGPTLDHGTGHRIALTFDDGPNPAVTPGLLDVLERAHVRATFFLVGRAATRHPDLVRRMLRDGDEIGNHTETHAHLNALFSSAALGPEIETAQHAIAAITGRAPRYLRPPFGARDAAAIAFARRAGLRVVMWSAMLGDEPAPAPPAPVLARQILAQIGDGAIVVMHDGDQGRDGHGGRSYEAAAVPALIAQLRARGYTFVTISTFADHA